MSRYIAERYKDFKAYEAGEQLEDREYIRLNTNESPFPPSPLVMKAMEDFDLSKMRLYPDPFSTSLRKKIADKYGILPENVLVTNGSDDVLSFAFTAFNEIGTKGEGKASVVFPDVTYNFYEILCGLHGVRYRTIPVGGDMTVDPADYMNAGANVVLPNPNAPTGTALPLSDIEKIVSSNRDHVVLIDEAYIDFGWETAVPLIKKYDNLLISQTYSKSRSFAGGRVGFALGDKGIISDLLKIQQSQSPYNVNSISLKLAEAALDDEEYYLENCRTIRENRRYTRNALLEMGFRALPSSTNFVFAKHPDIKGAEIYEELKKRGILVRHFDRDRIRGYNRISIGTKAQMDRLIEALAEIIKEYENRPEEEK